MPLTQVVKASYIVQLLTSLYGVGVAANSTR